MYSPTRAECQLVPHAVSRIRLAAQLPRRKVQTAKDRRGLVQAQATSHRIAKRLGLLINLLEHVVRIAVQRNVVGHHVERAHGVRDVAMITIDHRQGVGGDHGHLVIGQVDDLIDIARQG